MITEKMRQIDNDLKKLGDELNESRNNYNQIARKAGNTYAT